MLYIEQKIAILRWFFDNGMASWRCRCIASAAAPGRVYAASTAKSRPLPVCSRRASTSRCSACFTLSGNSLESAGSLTMKSDFRMQKYRVPLRDQWVTPKASEPPDNGMATITGASTSTTTLSSEPPDNGMATITRAVLAHALAASEPPDNGMATITHTNELPNPCQIRATR